MTDVATRASPLAERFERYFAIKTSADVDGTMAYFSPDMVTYVDATLGWHFDSYQVLKDLFVQYMPTWRAPAASYATSVLSNGTSAIVHMSDTPELFGGELRALAAVDFVDDRIVRWIDYWDGASFDETLYEQLRTPAARFSSDLRDGEVASTADPALTAAAEKLHGAFARADAAAATELLHPDVVLHDMSLRACQLGRIETGRYLARVLDTVPYGRSSLFRRTLGSASGGGFEWTSADGLVGITAIELDRDGRVTSLTSVYDSRQLAPERKAALVASAVA